MIIFPSYQRRAKKLDDLIPGCVEISGVNVIKQIFTTKGLFYSKYNV